MTAIEKVMQMCREGDPRALEVIKGKNCPSIFGVPDGECGGICEACWNREVDAVLTNVAENAEKATCEFCKTADALGNRDKHILETLEKIRESSKSGRVYEGFVELTDKDKIEPPHILDSGTRREFESGAVRDIQEGKGRCDLMPLGVVAECLDNSVLSDIAKFQQTGDVSYLYGALDIFDAFLDDASMFLDVSKHFEEGAKKYGEHNWQKGIPTHCYIDSAVRHYLKFLRGDIDEPHDRAFVWNILCCIWTCKHKPELNDYRKDDEK